MDSFRIQRYVDPATLPAPIKVNKTKKKSTTLAKAEKLNTQIKKASSTFGIKQRQIQLAVENGEIDDAIMQFQRTAYSTLIAMIPIAEVEYRKWRRDNQAYALNALVQSARELASDLAASNDRSNLAEKLLRDALDPMFRELLQYVAQQSMLMKAFLQDKIKPQHINGVTAKIDMDLKDTAAYLQSVHGVVSEQIRRSIQGV